MALDLDKLAANAANAAMSAVNSGSNVVTAVKDVIVAALVAENEACGEIMDAYQGLSPAASPAAREAAATIRLRQA